MTAAQARATVIAIRRAINEYRDERWAGIVRTRNNANGRTFLAGLAALALLILAMVMHVDRGQLAAAAVFYLVGVIGGYFGLMYYNQKSDPTVEDYGLNAARLVRPLAFSGVAGIAAAVLIPMLAATADQSVSSTTESTATPTSEAAQSPAGAVRSSTIIAAADVPTPTPLSGEGQATGSQAAATQLSGGNEGVPSLDSLFDLKKRPFGVVLAFIFGISPDALLSIARRHADQLKDELRSTEAAEAPASEGR